MRQLRERPYLLLLTALLLLVVVYPVLHETAGSRELYDVLRTVVLLAALRVIFAGRRRYLTGVGLTVVLVLGVWGGHLFPGRWSLPLVLAFHALATAFFLAAVLSILGTVYRTAEVTADNVAGALCAYLLLGVVFAHGYWFIQTAVPGSFRGDGEYAGELSDPRKSLFALQYYSFVTLTSVGANDVTPVRPAARGLTILEAICGQFYIAVLIADLVGKRLAAPRPGERARPAPPAPDEQPTEVVA